jgi:hypothetical protein
MGFNTTVIVMNDALHDIERDPLFGKKLSDAISSASLRDDPIDVSAMNHVNAATVIETHHNSANVVVAVGGNCGTVLGWDHGDTHHKPADKERILRALANELGYNLHRKRK